MLFILLIWVIYLRDNKQYTHTSGSINRVTPVLKENERAKHEKIVREYECIPCQHGEPMDLRDD